MLEKTKPSRDRKFRRVGNVNGGARGEGKEPSKSRPLRQTKKRGGGPGGTPEKGEAKIMRKIENRFGLWGKSMGIRDYISSTKSTTQRKG